MDLSKLSLLETMKARMSFLSARQGVLAENVANANTPGYRARDVKAPDFAAMVSGEGVGMTAMKVTDTRHIATGPNDARGFRVEERPDAESTPNGNSVVLEDQMMKVASVQMDYSTVTQLYRKALNMIRVAAGGQR